MLSHCHLRFFGHAFPLPTNIWGSLWGASGPSPPVCLLWWKGNSRFLLLDLREWGSLFTKPLKPWGSQVTSTQLIRLLSSLTLNVEREDGKRKVRFTVQSFLLQDHSFLTISQPLGTSSILISFYTSFSILPSL